MLENVTALNRNLPTPDSKPQSTAQLAAWGLGSTAVASLDGHTAGRKL